MDQLNVRNVDARLWRRVREEATLRRVTSGELLNGILNEWADQLDAPPAADRRARAHAAMGMFRGVAPGRSLVDELIADRHGEFLREEEEMNRSAG